MKRMVHGKKPGAPTGTLPSPVAQRRGKSCSCSKAAKLPESLSQLILQAFEASTARKGLSLAALKKHLSEVGYSAPRNNSRLKRELNNLVAHGLLSRVPGTAGAAGSFRVSRPKKRTGPLEPEKKKKAVAGKKPQKKQLPGKKGKTPPRKSTPDPGRKRQQLRNHPAGANRKVPANKAPRGRKPSD